MTFLEVDLTNNYGCILLHKMYSYFFFPRMTAAVDRESYEFLDQVFSADTVESVEHLKNTTHNGSLVDFYQETSHKIEDFIERFVHQTLKMKDEFLLIDNLFRLQANFRRYFSFHVQVMTIFL